jgi:hypothetical protein
VDPAGSTLYIWDNRRGYISNREIRRGRERRRGPYLSVLADVQKVAMASVYGVVVRRRGSGASRRWQCRPLDRLGFGVGWRLGSEPRCLSPWPPLPLIWHCATRAHQPRCIRCPRSGRGQKVRVGRWANSVEIYSNIGHQ